MFHYVNGLHFIEDPSSYVRETHGLTQNTITTSASLFYRRGLYVSGASESVQKERCLPELIFPVLRV